MVENCGSKTAVKARRRSVTLYHQAKAVEVEEERLHPVHDILTNCQFYLHSPVPDSEGGSSHTSSVSIERSIAAQSEVYQALGVTYIPMVVETDRRSDNAAQTIALD